MDVAVNQQKRMQAANDPVKSDKPDMRGILCLSDSERWSVSDEDVELAARPDAFQPDAKL
jgi:hypothetical protein